MERPILFLGAQMLKINLNCLRKSFLSEGNVFHRFIQTRNLLLLRSNRRDLLSEKLIFRKYSFERREIFGVPGVNNEVQDELGKIKNEDEDEDEDEKKDYDEDDINDDLDDEKETDKKEIFEKIANGNSEILKKLKLLEFEIEVLNQQGFRVPSQLRKAQWEELLENYDASYNFKKKLLTFMNLNEKLTLRDLKKRQIRYMKGQMRKIEGGFHFYGISGQSILPVLKAQKLSQLLCFRSIMAEQKIVLDCSYQEYMNSKNMKNLGKQILIALTDSRSHRYPCQLDFCNLNKNDAFGKLITAYVPNIFDENFYCDVSSQGILDKYPKEKLIYLSPHAQNDLLKISKNDIFVIGAFVDKGYNVKASLAKAKKDQIRVAKLPLDHYICWKQGNKSLPINVVVNIMLDMFYYNDWCTAFKSISNRSKNDIFYKRKFISDEISEEIL